MRCTCCAAFVAQKKPAAACKKRDGLRCCFLFLFPGLPLSMLRPSKLLDSGCILFALLPFKTFQGLNASNRLRALCVHCYRFASMRPLCNAYHCNGYLLMYTQDFSGGMWYSFSPFPRSLQNSGGSFLFFAPLKDSSDNCFLFIDLFL